MRILQIGAAYVGAQKTIEKNIHDYLLDEGHESYILYATGETDDANIICYESKFNNLVRRFMRKVFGKNPHFAILGTLKLVNCIENIKPDLIHLHVIHNGYIDYIVLLNYLAKKGIPVVYTVHDMWAFTGGCYYYTNVKCHKFQVDCLECPKKAVELDCSKKKTNIYLTKKIHLFQQLKKVCFVSVSSWVSEEMLKSKLSQYSQYIVWNAIDDSEYIPVRMTKKADKKFTIIGVAANWDDRKGINRFFEMASALGEEYIILLVGTADEKMKSIAPSNIRFIGSITDKKELYQMYAAADIHVSMSFEETFGLTFIEAALSGIKSIGFDSTAIPMVLKKTFGYVVHTNQVTDVVEKIRVLSANREECQLSRCELEKVKESFSSTYMAKAYLEIYNEIL